MGCVRYLPFGGIQYVDTDFCTCTLVCALCNKPAIKTCDYIKSGKQCNTSLCVEHVITRHNKDYCPTHSGEQNDS